MNRTEAIAWMFSLCSHLRRSQAKTLSRIVPAAMETGQLSLAEVGRRLSRHTGAWAKHCIKRVDRLVGSVRIEPAEAMRGVVGGLTQPRKRLLMSLDRGGDSFVPLLGLGGSITREGLAPAVDGLPGCGVVSVAEQPGIRPAKDSANDGAAEGRTTRSIAPAPAGPLPESRSPAGRRSRPSPSATAVRP